MTSIHVIKVPDVGEGIAEVELVAWHVKPGDLVREDQGLADVMTDKASVEIPSPVAGRVLALGGEVGQMLAVGSELIRIDKDAAGPGGSAQAEATSPAPAAAPGERVVASAAPAAAAAATTSAAASRPPAMTAMTAIAAPSPPGAPAAAPAAAGERPIASPAVRRRAWELGIDLQDVAPSGTAGRVVHADLDAAVAAGRARPASPPTPVAAAAVAPATAQVAAQVAAPVAAAAAAAPAMTRRDDTRAVPVIGLRRRIALQMQEAKRRIPHFSYVEECDVDELEALRAELNARSGAARPHLTLLPFLMRAVVRAVAEHPQINAHFDDEAGVVTRQGAVHLGIATQTAHGLLVPVVRHAEALDPWAMAAEVARLSDSARAGRTTRAELSGSTITISSLGPLGGIVSTPIINRPEVAIVGVNRIVEKPVVRQGQIVVRRTMNLSSSFDHRVVDGADAARFVQALRSMLEHPALLFVD